MAWLQGLGLSARLMLGRALPRTPRRYATNPLWNHYRCADGEWIALAMLQADRYWPSLCDALGIPDAAADERFTTMLDRMMHAGDCIARLDAVFATRPRAEWLAILRQGGDFIFCVVNSVDQLPDDVQVQANGYVAPFQHPAFGPTRVVGVPIGLSDTPGSLRRPAPEFGQHTEEILTEVLGYSWDEVGRLRDADVI
jgi:crotonobetainyl-CoA:carnitine CoA-transferase CaiB-like acyl-CoA transferase